MMAEGKWIGSVDQFSTRGHFLYKLFRPEFLKNLPLPLSSDAFSQFGNPDNLTIHNKENQEAAKMLMNLVKQFASFLDDNYMRYKAHELTEILHREGINVRYIGVLRSHAKVNGLKALLLNEMVARWVRMFI